MKNGLFISGHKTTFIAEDFSLLKQHYRMKYFHMNMPKNPILLAWQLFKSFWNALFVVPKTDFIFCWFADYHAFWPLLFAKLFNKPSYLVIGGFDADKNLDFNYGAHVKTWRSTIVKRIALLATNPLPVSKHTSDLVKKNLGKTVYERSTIVYNGINTGSIVKAVSNRSGFITVYKVADLTRLKIKGADFLVEVARNFPDKSFSVVGPYNQAADYLNSFQLDNLEVLPPKPHTELLHILQSKKYYLQFSHIESFGIALVEGILSGCIPIGYGIKSTSEIIKTPELIFEELQIHSFKKALENAETRGGKILVDIQNHCKSQYDLKRRETELTVLIEQH